MNHHLKNVSYLSRHKWFVLRAGLKTKAPLHRLLVHDWTKLTPAEWGAYARSFGTERTPKVREDFDRAWLHHVNRNAHHWQHWVTMKNAQQLVALEMPEPLVREMVADWAGAGRAMNGRWEVRQWYTSNRSRILLADKTRVLVEELVGLW